ncbi:glycoside hydrolase family 32 protein [Butyrivibrio proteoclasticus]|uniref:glycoside hydrolase family 32 protein n=1 Tax=Butyrivibrio proteoclasticus TaxID=43305 RepID=UPI00047D402D|nr:glycoside hydrolase family 32 protein [Butyrivibrio proteoclasticus]
MQRVKAILLTGIIAIASIGCSQNSEDIRDESVVEEKYLGESFEDHSVFPVSVEGLIGDTMPFYDNGTYNVFYLADQRNGKQGYHPWGLIKTSDFVTYDDKGVVLNYADNVEDQDIALGTGSVIKGNDGRYHAFYTGHNDMFEPKEAVMHAVSDDMENWEKIPEDTLYAGEDYAPNDFRDPYVFYYDQDKCYYMLIATRKDNMGIIARYKSTDLTSWEDTGVFFQNDMGTDSNLECPTLLEYKGKWYLSFSDQWPHRLVHYRMANTMEGPFTIPAQDIFDCNGFYAGRMETDGENLYVVGWNGTKKNHTDSEDYDWGGNMVTHLLKQGEDGSLYPVLNPKLEEAMSNELAVAPLKMSESATYKDGNISFAEDKYEMAGFKELMGSYLIKTTIRGFDKEGMFGFCFNTNEESVGSLNIIFNASNNRIEFYNGSNIMERTAQSYVDYDFSKVDELKVSMIVSDGVVSMYVNDEIAFTTRMYMSQGSDWGVFSINSKVSFEELKVFK